MEKRGRIHNGVGKGEVKKRRSEVQVPFLVAVGLPFFPVLCLKEEPSPQRAFSH